jgi:hypothetical protein
MPLFSWILDVERAMWRILGDKYRLYLSYGYFQGRLYDTLLNFELPSQGIYGVEIKIDLKWSKVVYSDVVTSDSEYRLRWAFLLQVAMSETCN